jgi:DNA polymerase-1
MEFVNSFVKRNGYAYSIFGRKRNLSDVQSKDRKVVNRALRQGLNFTIQSAASDILLTSLLGASQRFKEAGLQARPVATVHDSIEIVCPQEEVKETLTILYDEMVNYPLIKKIFNIHFDVPLAIDAEVGNSFGDGKEVHFENGIPIL